MFRLQIFSPLLVFFSVLTLAAVNEVAWPQESSPWQRHTIDKSSRGADGVRLADVNGDGRQDMVSGWEEGGVVRVYLQPEKERRKQPWPRVTVGRVRSPEDAVFVDLDQDGAVDVVSCCEGRQRTVFAHWAPTHSSDYLNEAKWQTSAIPATKGKQMWMFALPLQLDHQSGKELIVGSKGKGATVGILFPGATPRDVASWTYQPLCDAGWIMSLRAYDMDGDGDQDVLFSDRRGKLRGVAWLENPGVTEVSNKAKWKRHHIGAAQREVMFLDIGKLGSQGNVAVACATRNKNIDIIPLRSNSTKIAVPNPFGVANGKAVALGDIDLDGSVDLVHTTNRGGNVKAPAVAWLSFQNGKWVPAPISSGEKGSGVKFDRIELLDIDEDGDLDVVSCEERDGLGVFWYENPTR